MDAHKNHRSFTSSLDFKTTHQEFFIKNVQDGTTPSSHKEEEEEEEEEEGEEESGRERLKRHRVEMSGRVWIPDIWGQEDLLKNYIDGTVFDSCLEKSSIMSAREALIQEGRSTMRIENSC